MDLVRERANPLGSYLRARRERIAPDQAGITASGIRRVPGLRREELAMLAGISNDYYLRLERGRDRHPSRQVLDALAAVLQLDQEQTAHLVALAAETATGRGVLALGTSVPTSANSLLHTLPHPAFIENRYFDILAANKHATAFNPRLAPGRNQLRDLLLDAEEQAMHPDGELAASCLIASLRYTIAGAVNDSRFVELTTELHHVSPQFREIWARNDVQAQRGATLTLTHPREGKLLLNREQLAINGSAAVKLVVYYPES